MLKRFTVAVAALFALAGSAFASGTISLSLSQQLDNLGKPLAGCKLYTYQAGTVATPQNAYSDSGLTSVMPNPMTCDAYGRLSQFFLADGSIKVRLTDKNGVTIYTADNILVVGPSGGGGGGGSVDATTVLATGDMKIRYGTGTLDGFVRANGRTIGSATSGATERANSDTQALFEYLWSADSTLSVSGGRGATANADWLANKTIALPDGRGRTIAGLDDMGGSSAGRLTATYFGASGGCSGALGTTLGAACGGESHTLTTAQIPQHSHGVTDPGHTHSQFVFRDWNAAGANNSSMNGTGSGTVSGTTFVTASASTGISIQNTGGGNPHPVVQPTIVMTIYIKL